MGDYCLEFIVYIDSRGSNCYNDCFVESCVESVVIFFKNQGIIIDNLQIFVFGESWVGNDIYNESF